MIGNQMLPEASDLHNFVRKAKSGDEIMIAAGAYNARVTPENVAVGSGTITVSEGPNETLVPIHAINSVSILRR